MGRKKVLITGAAGRIGQVLREGLKDRYDLRLMYHRTVLEVAEGEEVVLGSVADMAAIEAAVDGVDAVGHMAGDPSTNASWESVLEKKGVKRVIFASTNHVTGFYEQDGVYTTPELPERPDSLYGVSKAFGEDLGRYYVDEHGLEVICLRIGSFQPDSAVIERQGDRILSTWLSHRDCVQLVWRGIEADVRFGIYYGISANTRAYWDIQSARQELGYAPEDDAERLA
mgnify:CR=1 FL=1